MPRLTGGSYGHRIVATSFPDVYVLCWKVDTKAGRLRFARAHRRSTDRRGAERFAKKWKVKIPKQFDEEDK